MIALHSYILSIGRCIILLGWWLVPHMESLAVLSCVHEEYGGGE